MSFVLRKYQVRAIENVRKSIRAGNRLIVLTAPTGSGKTVIAAQIVESAAKKGFRVIFLAHRRELVYQCADKLAKFGVEHGIIMAGEYPEMSFEVQVASIDTLRTRCINTEKMPLPGAAVVIVDECHRSLAETYLKLFEAYRNAIIIGLTATPIRGDQKGLGHIYDDMVHCPTISGLIRLGHLVPPRTFAPTIPDLTGVKTKGFDYESEALEAVMNRRRLVGDIVTHWHRLAPDRPTIVFASGVKHSINLRDEFIKSGVRAAHIDGTTPLVERKTILQGLKDKRIQVVTNYAVLTEGFDEPILSAAVIARPTKHLGLHLQMAGRVLRPADNKEDALLIDHGGNVYEHGFVTDDHNWVLEEGKALSSTNAERQKVFDEKEPITCVQCMATYTGQLNCPYCGHVPIRKGKHLETVHGELMEIRASKRRTAKNRVFSATEKEGWYNMFIHYGREKEYENPEGWAAHKYKSKFKEWPENYFSRAGEEPTAECLSYIRSRNIAYAKAKEKEDALNDQAGS